MRRRDGSAGSRGIIGGYGDGTFGPGKEVTRQQFAKMIVLTGGYAASEANVCPFSDVRKSDAFGGWDGQANLDDTWAFGH